VQHDNGLGLVPHPDYRQPAWVLGGLQVAKCPQEFTFGHQGKPFLPPESAANRSLARQIVERLHKRCGPGNFDYSVILGDAEQIKRFFGY
jgi:hypothetical protein